MTYIDPVKKKRSASLLAVLYMVVGFGLAIWGFLMLFGGNQGKSAYAILGFLFLLLASQQLQIMDLWEYIGSRRAPEQEEAKNV